MKIVHEFKQFVQRGNVVDMAIGIVIGAAFAKIVTATVEGILTPPIGWVLSGIDFSRVGITLNAESGLKIQIGRLIQSLIEFFTVAVCLFMVMKAMNKLRGPVEEGPKEPPEDVKLLMEIRDLLKAKA